MQGLSEEAKGMSTPGSAKATKWPRQWTNRGEWKIETGSREVEEDREPEMRRQLILRIEG